MSVNRGTRPRRYTGTPLPEAQRQLRPEDVLRGFLLGVVILAAGFVLGNFTFNEIHGRGTAYFVMAAAGGVVLTAISYRRIEWAMAAFVLLTWMGVGGTPGVATGVTSGSSKSLALAEVGMAFLLFIWAVRALTGVQNTFVRSRLNGILIAYVAFCALCGINGDLFWDPAVAHFWGPGLNGGREPLAVTAFEVGSRILAVGAFWLFANCLHDEGWLRRMTWLFMVPGILVLLSYATGIHVLTQGYTFLLVGVVGCTLFAWLIEPRPAGVPARRGLRLLGWSALAVIVFIAGVTALKWVSGGLNLYVGLLFVAYLRDKRLFLTMLVMGGVFYVAGHAFLASTVIHKVQTSGDLYRVSMARAAVLYALKFPLGVGPGNYRSYNVYYGSSLAWNTAPFTSAHDFYAQALSEEGFGGLALVLVFVVTALVMLARFYRQLPAGWSRTAILGIAGMWAGNSAASCIGDYIIPTYHNGGVATMASTIYCWVGLGIGFAHARRCGLLPDRRKVPAAAPEAPSAADYYPRRMGRDAA